MPNSLPYLILLDSRNAQRAYAYVHDPDPATVHIACLSPDTIQTIGPWPCDRAHRHTQELQAIGYIAYAPVHHPLPPIPAPTATQRS